MAAAIVPLILGLTPTIINLIAALVHKAAPVAEAQLGNGSGPAKFGIVFGDVINALNKAAIAGQIDKALPPDPVIQLIIQACVQSMILSGLLGGSPAAPVSVIPSTVSATPLRSISILPGQSITISVAS